MQTGHRNAQAKSTPWTPGAAQDCKKSCQFGNPWDDPGTVLLPRWTKLLIGPLIDPFLSILQNKQRFGQYHTSDQSRSTAHEPACETLSLLDIFIMKNFSVETICYLIVISIGIFYSNIDE